MPMKPHDKLRRALEAAALEDQDGIAGDRLAKRPAARDAYVAKLAPGGRLSGVLERAVEYRTKPERISFIVDLISNGVYRSAAVAPLAKAWGVERVTVVNYASEAYRYVRESFGDREEIRANCLALLETITHQAIESGELKTAVASIRTVADITGLVVSKTEISGPNGSPIQFQDLSKLSDEDLQRAIVKAAAAAITADGGPKDSAAQAVLNAAQNLDASKPTPGSDEK